eukprot:1003172-Prymnesium_polylepis.1
MNLGEHEEHFEYAAASTWLPNIRTVPDVSQTWGGGTGHGNNLNLPKSTWWPHPNSREVSIHERSDSQGGL